MDEAKTDTTETEARKLTNRAFAFLDEWCPTVDGPGWMAADVRRDAVQQFLEAFEFEEESHA